MAKEKKKMNGWVKFLIVLLVLAIIGGGIALVIIKLGGFQGILLRITGVIEHEGLYYQAVEDKTEYCCWGFDDKNNDITIEELTIPSHVNGKPVTSINNEAFRDLPTLKKVWLPDTIERIGKDAFLNCNVSQINSNEPNTAVFGENIEDIANMGSTSLIWKVIIKGSTQYMTGDLDQFYNASYIEFNTMDLPLGKYFESLSKSGSPSVLRTEIKVYDGEYIPLTGKYTYDRYGIPTKLKTVKVNSGRLPLSAFADSKLTNIILGENVTGMDMFAFYDCDSLTNITLPCSPGSRAFQDCSNLKEVTLTDGVTSIGSNAFLNCTKMTLKYGDSTTKLPSSLRSISNSAFENCDSLVTLFIPESCTSIGEKAFFACDNLASVDASAVTIGASAFEDCKNLSFFINVCETPVDGELVDKLSSLGIRAFEGCYNLKKFYIPKTLKTISATKLSDSPFYNCSQDLKLFMEDSYAQSGFGSYWDCYGTVEKANMGKLTKEWDASLSDFGAYYS